MNQIIFNLAKNMMDYAYKYIRIQQNLRINFLNPNYLNNPNYHFHLFAYKDDTDLDYTSFDNTPNANQLASVLIEFANAFKTDKEEINNLIFFQLECHYCNDDNEILEIFPIDYISLNTILDILRISETN